MKKLIKTILKYNRKPVKKEDPLYIIGNNKHHNSLVDTLIPQLVEIGDNFISAPGSIILAHDASLFSHSGKYRCQKTVIGNNVFVGANAVILPGVNIGDGAIIGAGAVVSKDVASMVVVAGNPAKFICTVNEYLKKCELKGILYEPPKAFFKVNKGEKISKIDISEFQKKILNNFFKTDEK
ncbi:acyltransferase [Antarcticibacterium flavum]|uniref:Acyltransferase n=1 Tax=Antarcticibacterium flavum TaxID=2058175 RepID=A0A5B7WZJ8_9FLAO|nr:MULTISPECIES: acyltransferase [Antarcticibacterium]MCM4158775.1 hypothetical protein [Antarcticibacterium sp. W02-3]QCY68626.1 acyltransferase [Antarcticibacterium flavum]